jgi:hypothetical protein
MPLNAIATGAQPMATTVDAERASISNNNYSINANPLAGPYYLARLLSNLPVSEEQIRSLDLPWRSLGLVLLATDIKERSQVFETSIQGNVQASALRHAVFELDPNAPLPDVDPSPVLSKGFPELPKAANIPAGYEGCQAGLWLQNYMRLASQVAPMSDDAFHLSAGLFLLSTALARRVYVQAGVQRIYSNLYQLIVAQSTLHHKTTALAVSQALLKKSGLDLLLLASRQTPESLIAEMGTIRPSTFESWSAEEKRRWLDERAFSAQRGWLIDEASHLLDSFNRDYTAGLLPLVLALYDCPEREVSQTLGRGRQSVSFAYLSISGATTPSALAAHIQRSANWSNGLWARFAIVTPRKTIPDWHFFPENITIPDQLAQHLNHLAFSVLPAPKVEEVAGEVRAELPAAIPAQLAPGVYDAWERYAKAVGYDLLLEGGVDQRLWPSYGRLYIMAMKVAMLLATSDWSAQAERSQFPVIELVHWYQAQAIAETWRESVHRLLNEFGPGDDNQREDQVLRVLSRAASGGMTAREIGQMAHLKRDEVDALLLVLERDGLVERVQVEGQRVIRFHLVQKDADKA